jgi:WD40 repeat protein
MFRKFILCSLLVASSLNGSTSFAFGLGTVLSKVKYKACEESNNTPVVGFLRSTGRSKIGNNSEDLGIWVNFDCPIYKEWIDSLEDDQLALLPENIFPIKWLRFQYGYLWVDGQKAPLPFINQLEIPYYTFFRLKKSLELKELFHSFENGGTEFTALFNALQTQGIFQNVKKPQTATPFMDEYGPNGPPRGASREVMHGWRKEQILVKRPQVRQQRQVEQEARFQVLQRPTLSTEAQFNSSAEAKATLADLSKLPFFGHSEVPENGIVPAPIAELECEKSNNLPSIYFIGRLGQRIYGAPIDGNPISISFGCRGLNNKESGRMPYSIVLLDRFSLPKSGILPKETQQSRAYLPPDNFPAPPAYLGWIGGGKRIAAKFCVKRFRLRVPFTAVNCDYSIKASEYQRIVNYLRAADIEYSDLLPMTQEGFNQTPEGQAILNAAKEEKRIKALQTPCFKGVKACEHISDIADHWGSGSFADGVVKHCTAPIIPNHALCLQNARESDRYCSSYHEQYDELKQDWADLTGKNLTSPFFCESLGIKPEGSGFTDRTPIKTLYKQPDNRRWFRVVQSLAFSRDGDTLASVSGDNTVKLWDVTTSEVIKTLNGHSKSHNNTIAFSPNSEILATGSGNSVILWDVATGEVIKTLKGHNAPVRAVAFSPNGATLATGSEDNTVKLWNTSTHKLLKTLRGHRQKIQSVAFSLNGETLATAAAAVGHGTGSVKLWNVSSRRLIKTFEEFETAAFTPDGTALAMVKANTEKRKTGAPSSRILTFWDLSTKEVINTFKGNHIPKDLLVFSPDGKTLAGRTPKKRVNILDVATGRRIKTIREDGQNMGDLVSLVFSPDGKILVTRSWTGLKLWDTANQQLQWACAEMENNVVRAGGWTNYCTNQQNNEDFNDCKRRIEQMRPECGW